MIVYVVEGKCAYWGETSAWLENVFDTPEKAQAFCDEQNIPFKTAEEEYNESVTKLKKVHPPLSGMIPHYCICEWDVQ